MDGEACRATQFADAGSQARHVSPVIATIAAGGQPSEQIQTLRAGGLRMSGAWQEFEAESRDSSRRLLVLGAVLAVAVLAALRYCGGAEHRESAVPPSEPVMLERRPEVTFQLEDQGSATAVAPVPPRAAQSLGGGSQRYVGVYECVVNGQRVVSDHPCGADAQVRTLVVDQPDPRDVARQQQRTRAAQAGSGAAPRVAAPARSSVPSQIPQVAPVASPNAAACGAIDQAIANLNARMRAGYTSAEGEWLRADWHDLQKRREELRCGRR